MCLAPLHEGPSAVGATDGLRLKLCCEVALPKHGLCAAVEEVEAGGGRIDGDGVTVEDGAAGARKDGGRAGDHTGGWLQLVKAGLSFCTPQISLTAPVLLQVDAKT